MRICLLIVLLTSLSVTFALAQPGGVRQSEQQLDGRKILTLANGRMEFSIVIDSGFIASQQMTSTAFPGIRLQTDGDFKMELMWTDWQAPKYFNNGENPVTFSKADFTVARYEFVEGRNGDKELQIFLAGVDMPLLARRTYRLGPRDFFVREGLAVADTSHAGHFLQHVWPLDGLMSATVHLVNQGGFGQPVAWVAGSGGVFFGVEYPAAENVLREVGGGHRITWTVQQSCNMIFF